MYRKAFFEDHGRRICNLLREEDNRSLSEGPMAACARTYPDHCDERGNSVQNYLMDLGVNGHRLIVVTYGVP
jgi:hypothetical protein